MARKLLIVNNGLKNLGGHYFETSVSIADAARKLGYRPILAAHVSCPGDIIPDWLDFYPLFCTDHWMCTAQPVPPDLRGLRGDAVHMARVTVDSVLHGTHGISDYLRSRFEAVTYPEEPAAAPQPVPVPPPMSLRDRVKGIVRATVPPVFIPALRWMYHRRHVPALIAKAVLRNGLPPFAYTAMARAKHRLLHREPAPVPPPPPALPAHDTLRVALERHGLLGEHTHMEWFRRDLERLLCLAGATSEDHVFLPTAHGRELLAIHRLVEAMKPLESPTFHLEFRHALDLGEAIEGWQGVHPYQKQHEIFFDHARRRPQHDRIKVYTDTTELTEEFESFSGLTFGTLPIPFRTGFLKPHQYRPGSPVRIAFFGNVREEKGFALLPDLVEALWKEYVLSGKAQFLIQGSLSSPKEEKRSHAALRRLRKMDPKYVKLVGVDGPLSTEEYYQLVSQSDLLLCPYNPLAYRRRSSGTFTEAVAAGIPTVVPKETWLERQQPPGTGEGFSDLPTFIAAVRRILDDYPRYLRTAKAHRDSWLAVHTPMNLVKALLQPEEEASTVTRAA